MYKTNNQQPVQHKNISEYTVYSHAKHPARSEKKLEKADDAARGGVDVDVIESGAGGQAGNGHDVAADRCKTKHIAGKMF